MLERTAAYLEPRSLRVLPSHNNAIRSTRQLHTAFWQHGAAELELTSAWQALMHGTLNAGSASLEQTRSVSLGASAFLLDFLYPAGALALLRRRLPRILPDHSDGVRFRARPSRVSRLYNSSLSGREPDPLPSPAQDERSPTASNGGPASNVQIPTKSDTQDPSLSNNDRHIVAIELILKHNDIDQVDVLWRHYKSLDQPSQDALLYRVLVFLSTTSRVADDWKISELFHKLDALSWDNVAFIAGLSAEIKLKNNVQALSIFERGLRSANLDETTLVDALDLLLEFSFIAPTTAILEDVWKLYPAMASRWNFDGITADLKRSASVPGLAKKAVLFLDYIDARHKNPETTTVDGEALQALRKIVVRKALVSCEDSDVVSLLLRTKDFLAFEEYFRLPGRQKKKITAEVYRTYRRLDGSLPSHAVLHAAFQSYTKTNTPMHEKAAGVELVWRDWLRFHGIPTRRAYQKHLAFHAARGDKDKVYALWSEYIECFRDDPNLNILDPVEGGDTFAHLLHVNAINAEPEEAQRIFDAMTIKFKLRPTLHSWNILLNAYVRGDDYDGAISTFNSLCEVVQPDVYSYATLMKMSGSRGDLTFTVDLYRRARNSDIPINQTVYTCLVDAYCQNDHFQEAADICLRATDKLAEITQIWNKLLYHHAVRRNLASMNKIIITMSKKDVPLDQFTYEQLLLGLTLCDQSQHALHLLNVALRDKVFEVTPTHFQMVMASLLRTREPTLVKRLCVMMSEHGIPVTEDVALRLSQSLTQFHKFPARQRWRHTRDEWLDEAMRLFSSVFRHGRDLAGHDDKSLDRPMSARSSKLLLATPDIYQFGTMAHVFARLNENTRVNDTVKLYREIFQDGTGEEDLLPRPILDAMMLSAFKSGQYKRVKEIWQLSYEQARLEAREAGSRGAGSTANKISARYRYSLCAGLRVMQEVFLKEKDSSGLLELIRGVREAGFTVDSKNWNYYVQSLVQLQEYKVAFTVCEEVLMPSWTGWYLVRYKAPMRNSLELDQRRRGMYQGHLRPTTTTLYWLARGYLELASLGSLSPKSAATLGGIETECARTMRAIHSMVRVNSPLEQEIFAEPKFPDTDDIFRAASSMARRRIRDGDAKAGGESYEEDSTDHVNTNM